MKDSHQTICGAIMYFGMLAALCKWSIEMNKQKEKSRG
jgi:hypothetical protein